MIQYLELMHKVATTGNKRGDRTGTGTVSLFGETLEFDVSSCFPLLTTKKLHWKSIVTELLWFLSGETSATLLQKQGVTIWDEWATPNGELGPIYGSQWRHWGQGNIDQIAELVHNLRTRPFSRRHVVSAWNPDHLPDEQFSPQKNVVAGKMALAPCHCLFQCYVHEGSLSLQMYQRSADLFLGVPYNIASYALLLYMLAQQTGFRPGELIIQFGDVHLYNNHLNDEIVFKQLVRSPKLPPILHIKEKAKDIFSYKLEDFEILDYLPHSAIKAPISV